MFTIGSKSIKIRVVKMYTSMCVVPTYIIDYLLLSKPPILEMCMCARIRRLSTANKAITQRADYVSVL